MSNFKIMQVNKIPSNALLKWHKLTADNMPIEKWLKTLNGEVFSDGDFYCCCHYSNDVLFIAYLACLNSGKNVKKFIFELIDYYEPEYVVGFRKNRCLFYNVKKDKIKYVDKDFIKNVLDV